MLLTHRCPNCGVLHEKETTPEPSRACGACEKTAAGTVVVDPGRTSGACFFRWDGDTALVIVGNIMLRLTEYQLKDLQEACQVALSSWAMAWERS